MNTRLPKFAQRNQEIECDRIVIIAILAGMLLPALGKTKGTAKTSQCISNVKQITLAMHLYRDTYDDNIPYWSTYAGTNWKGKLQVFVGNNYTLWNCPAGFDIEDMGINGSGGPGSGLGPAFYNDFKKGNKLKYPQLLVYTGDGVGNSTKYGAYNGNGGVYTSAETYKLHGANCTHTGGGCVCWDGKRHNGTNWGIVDGHVEKCDLQTAISWVGCGSIYSGIGKKRWMATYTEVQ